MKHMLLSIGAAATAAVLTFARAGAAPVGTGKTVSIVGSESFQPDEFFSVTYRFLLRHVRVHSGETITWNNRTTDGHTISVVSRADIPTTIDRVNNCGVCNQLQAAHFPNGFPPAGQPVLVLDDFKAANPPARLDSPGDSLLAPPPGLGLPTSVSAIVTAPAGTELAYICSFHAWTQGTIRVLSDNDPEAD